MKNIVNFNKFEPVWENTVYDKTDVGYNGLLANPELLQNSFWINLIGFIGTKLMSPNSQALHSYFGANKVRLEAINHDSGDLFVLIKACKDAKLIDEKTTNEITRFFALVKNKPDVVLDEKLIRSMISKIDLKPFDKLNSDIKNIIHKITALRESFKDPNSIKDFVKPIYDIASKNKWAPELTRIISDEVGRMNDDTKVLLGFLDKEEEERKKREEEERKRKEDEEKLRKANSFLDDFDFSAGFSYFTNPSGKERINRRLALRKAIPMKTEKDVTDYFKKIKLNKKHLKAFIFGDIAEAKNAISAEVIKREYGIDYPKPEGILAIPDDQFYTENNLKNIGFIFEGLPNKDKLSQYFKIKTFESKFNSNEYTIYSDELWDQILNVTYDELAINSTASYGNKKKQNIWEGDNYYGKTRGWAGFNSFANSIRTKISEKLRKDLETDPNKAKDLISVLEKTFSETSGDKKQTIAIVQKLLSEVFGGRTEASDIDDGKTPKKPMLYEYPELMEFLNANGYKDVIATLYENIFGYGYDGNGASAVKFKDQLFKLKLLGKSGFTRGLTDKDAERDYPIGKDAIGFLLSVVKQGTFDNDNYPYAKSIVASNGLLPLLDSIDGYDEFIEKYKHVVNSYFLSFVNNKKWFPEGVDNRFFWDVLDKEYLNNQSRDGILFDDYYGHKPNRDAVREVFINAKDQKREIAKRYINTYLSSEDNVNTVINNFSKEGHIDFMFKFGGEKAINSFLSKILNKLESSRWANDNYKYKEILNVIVTSSIDYKFKVDEKIFSEHQPQFMKVLGASYYKEEFLFLIVSLIPIYGKWIFEEESLSSLLDLIVTNKSKSEEKNYNSGQLKMMYVLEKYNPPMGDELKKHVDTYLGLNDPAIYKNRITKSFSSLNSDYGMEQVDPAWLKSKRMEFRTVWQDRFNEQIKSEVYEEYAQMCSHSLTESILKGQDKDTDEKTRKEVLKAVAGKFETAKKSGSEARLAGEIRWIFDPVVFNIADKEDLRNIFNIGLRKYLNGITSATDLYSEDPEHFLEGIEKSIKEDAVTQKEADEILWSQQSMSIKIKFSKLIKETTLIGPVMDQIAGENTPIKPLIGTHDSRGQQILRKALQFNNFEIHKMEGVKKMGGENIFEYKKRLIKTYQNTAKEMIELKVKKIEETEEERDKKMGFFFQYMTPDGRHGGQGVRFLESFDVDMVPEGMEEWIKNNPDPHVIPAFHGTGSIAATMILRFGFKIIDQSIGLTTGRMLGDGVYFSNVLDKASQYIGDSGFSRSRGTIGYLMECEAYVGKDGIDHKSAGLGSDSIRSAEWCVFNPRVQLKIVKAHKVEIVDRKVMEDSFKKWFPKGLKGETNESNSGIIKEFSEFNMLSEKRDPSKPEKGHWCNFTFIDGHIPDGKGNKLRFDTWMKEFVDKNNPSIHVYPSQKGPNVNMNVDDINLEGNFIIPNTQEFMDKDENFMYTIFKDALKECLKDKNE